MKKLLALLLAALFVVGAVGAAVAEEPEPEGQTVSFVENAPYSAEGGEIVVDDGVYAGELLSCLADRTGASVIDAAGETLAANDAANGGETLVAGDASAKIVRLGDANADGRFNARDVIAAMLGIVTGDVSRASDVDGNGSTNGRDVLKIMRKLVGWDEDLVLRRESAEYEDSSLTLYFTSTMLRIDEADTTVYGDPEGLIYAAKNEIEDAHLMLVSTEAKSDLTLDVGDIKNAAGDVLEREVRYGYYYSIGIYDETNHLSNGKADFGRANYGRYTDPYPTLNAPFAVGENCSKSFIIKVKTKADTAAGWYSAPVSVLDPEGKEIKRSTLYVYVWDFTLDETPACKTIFGMDFGGMAWNVSVFDGAVWGPAYANDWFEYSLENKITPQGLPVGEYTDRYMDDPRVTAFVSATGSRDASAWDKEGFADEVRATYEHLATKQEWLDKAYIYTVDEPWSSSGANCVKKQWECATAALGDIEFKTILPISSNCWMDDLKCDMFEFCLDYCNAVCPQSNCWTISAPTRERKKNKDIYPDWAEYMDDAALAKYGQFRPRFDQIRERGDDVWWYICIGPQPPYANWWMAQQGAVNRTVLWQQYYYDIDGILYWAMTFWNMSETNHNLINLKRINNGDGLLFYNGALWDEYVTYAEKEAPIPVPSIRFEEIRDGIEDFQYLRQLEREVGRDAALEYTTRVTTDILRYSDDWHDIDSARNEMGWELEQLEAAK